MRSFVEIINSERAGLIYLLCGEDQGKMAWYYLQFKNKTKYMILKQRLEREKGRVDLTAYGEVLQSGWGEMPPEDVKEYFKNIYK